MSEARDPHRTTQMLARASALLPGVMLLLMAVEAHSMAIAFIFIACPVIGVASGAWALLRTRGTDARGILVPAAIGIGLNGLLIIVFISNTVAWLQRTR